MNKTLETVLTPCKHSNLGAIALLLLVVGACIWLVYVIGCFLCKGIKFLWSEHKKAQSRKGVQIKRDTFVAEKLSTFGKFEYCLQKNLNVLYYTIRKCTHGKTETTFYVDFMLPDNENLWNVNRVMYEYLLRDMCILKIAYKGKNKGCVVMKGLDEMKIVSSLTKLYGTSVRLLRLENDEL